MGSYRDNLERLIQGTGIEINGEHPWDVQVHEEDFHKRVFSQGSLGLGESYMDGWWDCERLDLFFERLFKSEIEQKIRDSFRLKWMLLKARLFNRQEKEKSSKSIKKHYDIGNDLFEQMLDPLLIYSCGYWQNTDSLTKAQEQKLDLICQKLDLQPGDRVLDIGCGWGGFAYFAAKNYGVQVVGITISEEQQRKGVEVCQDLPVEIRLQDYRDIDECFDKIVSIGMVEHVGHKNYRQFMEVTRRNLKDEGLALLHFIGSNTTSFTTDPWIDKYIFPGGVIPSIQQIGKALEGELVMLDWQNFGRYYDKTLMAWKENFDAAWESFASSYSEEFKRMWHFYLCSSAASFRTRRLNLWQLVLSKKEHTNNYRSIRPDQFRLLNS